MPCVTKRGWLGLSGAERLGRARELAMLVGIFR